MYDGCKISTHGKCGAPFTIFFKFHLRCKDVVGCLAVFHVYSGGGWAVFVDCCPSVDPQLTCISKSHMLLEVRGRRVERTSIN